MKINLYSSLHSYQIRLLTIVLNGTLSRVTLEALEKIWLAIKKTRCIFVYR